MSILSSVKFDVKILSRCCHRPPPYWRSFGLQTGSLGSAQTGLSLWDVLRNECTEERRERYIFFVLLKSSGNTCLVRNFTFVRTMIRCQTIITPFFPCKNFVIGIVSSLCFFLKFLMLFHPCALRKGVVYCKFPLCLTGDRYTAVFVEGEIWFVSTLLISDFLPRFTLYFINYSLTYFFFYGPKHSKQVYF